MKRAQAVLVCGIFLAAATTGFSGKLSNTSFETDFGPRANMNVWGDFGDSWGEAYQVNAGHEKYVEKALTGARVLLINVPPASWNGVWQQVPWGEKKPFAWKAYYQIKGGDLPDNCSTFMKVEFYDGNDAMLGSAEGEHRKADTKGHWVSDTLKGETPAGTAALRFILIAGGNEGGANILDRIYWDDADTIE
jgi:hypothetical protein